MKKQDLNELCAKCGFPFDGHISNTGVLYPCWKPSGTIQPLTDNQKAAQEATPRRITLDPLKPPYLPPKKGLTEEDVAAYVFGRIWTAKNERETARWSNVLNHLRAAVIGDRKEAEAEKALVEAKR